jgi:hypothetical protein
VNQVNDIGLPPTGTAVGSPGIGSAGIAERASAVLNRASEPSPQSSAYRDEPQRVAKLEAPGIEQLRKQAGEWVEGLLSLVTRLPRGGIDLPNRGADPAPLGPSISRERTKTLTVLASAATKPGEVAQIKIRLANESGDNVAIGLVSTDLVTDTGGRIPNSSISFRIGNNLLAPGARNFDICVDVPSGTLSGRYLGLIQVIGQPDARALLSVDVE